jgi:hypothetical protein
LSSTTLTKTYQRRSELADRLYAPSRRPRRLDAETDRFLLCAVLIAEDLERQGLAEPTWLVRAAKVSHQAKKNECNPAAYLFGVLWRSLYEELSLCPLGEAHALWINLLRQARQYVAQLSGWRESPRPPPEGTEEKKELGPPPDPGWRALRDPELMAAVKGRKPR